MTLWLALLGLLLLPGARRRSGRHRQWPSRGRPTGRASMVLAAGSVLLLCVLAGRPGQLVAAPAAAGVAVAVRWLAGRTHRVLDRRAAGYLLDLIAAVLTTGAPPDRAIEAVTEVARRYGNHQLVTAAEPVALVGRLLRLGTEPAQAWSALAEIDELRPVAAAGRRCADSGARLAEALTEVAAELRERQLGQLLARSQRTGVLALLPLACCFLPAFICLGLVPVIVGLAGRVLPG